MCGARCDLRAALGTGHRALGTRPQGPLEQLSTTRRRAVGAPGNVSPYFPPVVHPFPHFLSPCWVLGDVAIPPTRGPTRRRGLGGLGWRREGCLGVKRWDGWAGTLIWMPGAPGNRVFLDPLYPPTTQKRFGQVFLRASGQPTIFSGAFGPISFRPKIFLRRL